MKFKTTFPALAFMALAHLPLAGCLHISSDPIHIIMDVNVKVDKALDDFFGDIDKKSTTITTPAETADAGADTNTQS